jgi:hypothetical protein
MEFVGYQYKLFTRNCKMLVIDIDFRHFSSLSGRYQAKVVRSLPTISADALLRCSNRRRANAAVANRA